MSDGDFEDSTLASAHRPGYVLREERIRRKLELDVVSRQLRLSMAQVTALESDDYEKLPGTTFVRGFIRNYARILDIDAEPLIARYELLYPPPSSRALSLSAPRGEVGSSTTRLFPGPKRRQRRARLRLAASALVVLILLLFASGMPTRWVRSISEFADAARSSVQVSEPTASIAPIGNVQAQPVGRTQPQPVAATPALVIPVASVARVELNFGRQSWVEVRDNSDKRLMSQLNPAGSRQTVEGKPPLSLVVGNASEVVITYNGKPVDLAPHTRVNVARLTLE